MGNGSSGSRCTNAKIEIFECRKNKPIASKDFTKNLIIVWPDDNPLVFLKGEGDGTLKSCHKRLLCKCAKVKVVITFTEAAIDLLPLDVLCKQGKGFIKM